MYMYFHFKLRQNSTYKAHHIVLFVFFYYYNYYYYYETIIIINIMKPSLLLLLLLSSLSILFELSWLCWISFTVANINQPYLSRFSKGWLQSHTFNWTGNQDIQLRYCFPHIIIHFSYLHWILIFHFVTSLSQSARFNPFTHTNLYLRSMS